MAGFGLDGLVLGSSETRKTFLKSDQGHIWTTFIEAVSASGEMLTPTIIFKDKDLQVQWFLQEFQKIAPWHYICSENGWTSNEIIISWLEHIYLPQTISLLHDESEARLLILDGHLSHISVSYLGGLGGQERD